jgi:hypothetical protein
VLASLLARDDGPLGSPSESVLVQQLRTLELLFVLGQLRAERIEFQPLYGLDEWPKLPGMERHATPNFVGHNLVIVPALVQEQEPTHCPIPSSTIVCCILRS